MGRDAATAEEIVYQSNSLIMRKTSLSIVEQRLLLSILAQIQPDDADFKPYKISVKEFMELCGVKNGRMYVVIDSVIVPFARTVVRVGEKTDISYTLLARDYKKAAGQSSFRST